MNKNRQFNFRMSDKEYNDIYLLSQYFGLTSSDVLRLCVSKAIEKLDESDPKWRNKHTPSEVYDKRQGKI